MGRKQIEEQLRKASKELLLISLDELEKHDADCRKSVSDFEELAPALDPRDDFANRDGLEFIKLQNAIGHRLLEARRLIEQLPPGAKMFLFGARTMQEIQGEAEGD